MKHILVKNQFTLIGPDAIWKLYSSTLGIFRGGGASASPKLARADGPRRSDLLIVYDVETQQEMVHPSSNQGLSFADSIEVLSRKRIEGQVWLLPKGAALPEGLGFNVKDLDHPLLNVTRIMSVLDMTARLTQLAEMMEPCLVKIDKAGQIIEQAPGALRKVAGR